MNFLDPGVFCEVYLPPTSDTPQLTYSLTQQDAYIGRHPAIIRLAHRVNLSYAITSCVAVESQFL